MITVALILAAMAAVLLYISVRMFNEIHWLREELQTATDTEHVKCMAAVMKYVGDEWAAQVLEVAAADYESGANHSELDRISRLRYQPGGSPVPTLWLQERAMKLRIMNDWGIDATTDATKMNLNEYTFGVEA